MLDGFFAQVTSASAQPRIQSRMTILFLWFITTSAGILDRRPPVV
jgi:hypothetical protein